MLETMHATTVQEVRQEIHQLSQDTSLANIDKGRLREILDTNLNEVADCWRYISTGKTEGISVDQNKFNFIRYLANTEGCTNGRNNQVYLYFQGVDEKLIPMPEEHVLDTAPTQGSSAHTDMMAQITSVFTKAQAQNETGLPEDVDKETAKQYIKPFFTQRKEQDNIAMRQMTSEVFDTLFDDVWDVLNA